MIYTNPFFHCFCSCRVLIFNIAANLAFSVSFDPLIGLACVSSETHNLQAIFSSYLVLKPSMFCEESLGLELFLNSSVQEFYGLKALIPLEQVNTWVVEKKESQLAKDELVWCCKISLYANESCDEHAVYFRE